MSEDSFPAAEKILTDIENVFKRDKDLKDFEILPVTVGENKSPVIHAEHTLGLQQWCVRHLYLHVYHKLMNLKQQQRLRREDPVVLSRLLLGAVLLNPECTLLWNIRRDFVVMGRFDPICELHVSAIALSRRPKASEAFVYRRWVLNRIIASPLEDASSYHLLEEELRVSLMAADRYPNNYYAWNHRMWIMSHLPKASEMLSAEWTFSETWVSRHVSEHSGLQYRQYLLKKVLQHLGHSEWCLTLHKTLVNFLGPLKNSTFYGLEDFHLSKQLHLLITEDFEKKEPCTQCPIFCEQIPFVLHVGLLAYDLLLVTELLTLYPGHEALWCHRRFILFSLYSLSKEVFAKLSEDSDVTDGIPLPKTQKLSVLESDFKDCFLWRLVMWYEEKLLSGCAFKTSEECYQSKLAHRHRNWIDNILISRVPGASPPRTQNE